MNSLGPQPAIDKTAAIANGLTLNILIKSLLGYLITTCFLQSCIVQLGHNLPHQSLF